MGRIGISITKRTAFRGGIQHFSNTYYYGSPPGIEYPDQSRASALIDEVVNVERPFHGAGVTFVNARLWTAEGLAADNTMILTKALTGTGGGSSTTADPERAILMYWPAGKDRRGRPVYLRKWYHTIGVFGSTTLSTYNDQQTPIPTATRDTFANAVKPVTRIGVGIEGYGLVAKGGRERTGAGDPICHRWLEHHQLGEEWRG